MKTYTVTAERAGTAWHVRVPELNRLTQARWASEVEGMARDLIEAMTDADQDSFDTVVMWQLPENAERHLERSRELAKAAAAAQEEGAAEYRLAAKALHDEGLGSTEIGRVLGVSRQRANQLISS